MVESKIKVKNQYTSSILKFKLNHKIQHNVAVAALTDNKIPLLETLAEDMRKIKSMMYFQNDQMKPKHRTQETENKHAVQLKKVRTTVMPIGLQEVQVAQSDNQQQSFDNYVVGDSVDSMTSFDEESEDHYSNSIIVSAMVKESEDLVDRDLLNLLSYIKKLKIPSDDDIAKKGVEFGEIIRYKTLVFDLDETLIHSQQILPTQAEQDIQCDFVINLPNNAKFGVKQRPYVQKCLEHLSQYYEMAVFTAAEQGYADIIIDRIDPEKKFFQHRLYRQHCFKIDDVYVKDLRIIQDRQLEEILIVDNSILSFAFQLDNGIPICAFLSNTTQDQELLFLITYLEEVYHQKDCRVTNKKTFKLSEMMSKVA